MMVRTIGEIIQGRAPACISRQSSVAEAGARMLDTGVTALVVLDEIGMCGIVTAGDIARQCEAVGAPAELMRVDTIMTRGPETIQRSAGLTDALERMLAGGFEHLPVVDPEGCVVGIVAISDVPDAYRQMVERFQRYRLRQVAA